jgi:hypothetical protein
MWGLAKCVFLLKNKPSMPGNGSKPLITMLITGGWFIVLPTLSHFLLESAGFQLPQIAGLAIHEALRFAWLPMDFPAMTDGEVNCNVISFSYW